MMLRLISGQASNAEQQERIFNHIKRITGSTSNYHPEQIIPNLLVRHQAENEMHLHANDTSQQQAEITKLAEVLPPNTNTSIPLRLIRNHDGVSVRHTKFISNGNEAEDSLPTKQDQGITTPAGIVQPDENDDRIND